MTKRYAVHNLRCAGCAARIEDAIAGLPGVKSAAINLDSARLRVEGEQPFRLRGLIPVFRAPEQRLLPLRGKAVYVEPFAGNGR